MAPTVRFNHINAKRNKSSSSPSSRKASSSEKQPVKTNNRVKLPLISLQLFRSKDDFRSEDTECDESNATSVLHPSDVTDGDDTIMSPSESCEMEIDESENINLDQVTSQINPEPNREQEKNSTNFDGKSTKQILHDLKSESDLESAVKALRKLVKHEYNLRRLREKQLVTIAHHMVDLGKQVEEKDQQIENLQSQMISRFKTNNAAFIEEERQASKASFSKYHSPLP